MSGGIIAATVAGSFFGLLLIGAACYFLCCKTSEKTVYKPNDKGSDGGETSDQTVKLKHTTGNKTGSESEEHLHLMVASTLNNSETKNSKNEKYFI